MPQFVRVRDKRRHEFSVSPARAALHPEWRVIEQDPGPWREPVIPEPKKKSDAAVGEPPTDAPSGDDHEGEVSA
jgi:hypothetical protein